MRDSLAREKHYRVKELADLWGFSENTIIKLFGNEVTGGIAEVDMIDHRNDRPVKSTDVNANFFCNLPKFPAVKEYRCRVSDCVIESARLPHRLRQRNPPGAERVLALGA